MWLPAFRALLDNYESETGRPEVVSADEVAENQHFLDVVYDTAVMRRAHAFLASRGRAPESRRDFKHLLYRIWFELYRRQRQDR